MYPICKFEHLGETFTPAKPVPSDHPMVLARPDLFTTKTTRKPKE